MIPWVTVVLVVWFGAPSAMANGAGDLEARARALEARFLVPCCYQQAMDVHDSPLTSELKQEIRSRLSRGESPEAVEREFIARYGAKVVAVPSGNPLEVIALAVMVGVFGAGVAVWWRARRWVRSAQVDVEPRPPDDPYDAALEEELRALDR